MIDKNDSKGSTFPYKIDAKLIQLAASPQIDHVIVLCEHDQLFCDNEHGGAYGLIKEMIDVRYWKLISLASCENKNPAMLDLYKELCLERNNAGRKESQ